MNYSYNPLEIGQNSVSRARFELGDTMVEGGAETCMLSDEEYAAILDANPKWKAALYRLADAIEKGRGGCRYGSCFWRG